MQHRTGEFTGHGGIRLFRQSWHPRTPPRAVVLNLHGLGDHSGLYVELVNHLLSEGFAVHAYDARGNGRSAGQRAYIESWAEYRLDLRAFHGLVREEEPGRPVFLVGTSLGGLVALDYALEFPDGIAGVIALSPPLGALAVPKYLLAAGRILSRVWPRFSLETGMDLSGLARDPAVAEAVLGDPLFHRFGTARLATEVEATIARIRAIRRFPVPLLLVHGTADRMVPPEGTRAFEAALPDGDHRLIEVAGGYHALVADIGREAILEAMTRWMAERL